MLLTGEKIFSQTIYYGAIEEAGCEFLTRISYLKYLKNGREPKKNWLQICILPRLVYFNLGCHHNITI